MLSAQNLVETIGHYPMNDDPLDLTPKPPGINIMDGAGKRRWLFPASQSDVFPCLMVKDSPFNAH
jgi:hypothetical protein